jgi:hypothetical protein
MPVATAPQVAAGRAAVGGAVEGVTQWEAEEEMKVNHVRQILRFDEGKCKARFALPRRPPHAVHKELGVRRERVLL